ncbi:MAG: hypothetical protein H6642_18215 [Caldilineaceae bacterium]|nr:hypothetical protein [Caldilineaceae bacterium]
MHTSPPKPRLTRYFIRFRRIRLWIPPWIPYWLLLLIIAGGLGACRRAPVLPPTSQPPATPIVTAAPPVGETPTAQATPEASKTEEADTEEEPAWMVIVDAPEGRRLSDPVVADDVAAGAGAPAELGATPVRVLAPENDVQPYPRTLLMAVPAAGVPLETFVEMLAESLRADDSIQLTGQRMDYQLAAGIAPVGLLQYEQHQADGVTYAGVIAVRAHQATDTFALVIMLYEPQVATASAVETELEEILSTLSVEPYAGSPVTP